MHKVHLTALRISPLCQTGQHAAIVGSDRGKRESVCVCARICKRGKERARGAARERVRFTVFGRERERQIKAQAKDWSETA